MQIINTINSSVCPTVQTRRSVQCRVGLVDRPTAAVGVHIVTVGTRDVGSNHAVAQRLRSRILSGSQQFKVVLLLFATLQTKDAQICTELHREFPAALWSLELYSSIYLNLCQQSLLSDLLNQRKSTPKHVPEGVRLSQLFRLFCHKQANSYLINHPDQSIKLSEF